MSLISWQFYWNDKFISMKWFAIAHNLRKSNALITTDDGEVGEDTDMEIEDALYMYRGYKVASIYNMKMKILRLSGGRHRCEGRFRSSWRRRRGGMQMLRPAKTIFLMAIPSAFIIRHRVNYAAGTTVGNEWWDKRNNLTKAREESRWTDPTQHNSPARSYGKQTR